MDSDNSKINRRKILKVGIGAGALLGYLPKALGEVCLPTKEQTEGPFYPERDFDKDNDLTQLGPNRPVATGKTISVIGTVQDEACRPIAGAVVEIWQAAASGKYNHSGDESGLELDPNFQYWGRTKTSSSGNYNFHTILPGHYPVGSGRYRPPHIHYKAHAPGFFSITTQLYFAPESFSDSALAKRVKELNDAEGVDDSLKVHFQNRSQLLEGRFDLTLKRH